MYEDVVAFWQENQATKQELKEFCMLFAYHCNAIGNPQTTLEATKGIYEHGGVSAFTGTLRTLIEIENQKYMAVFLKDKVAAKEPLSVELVKAVHKKLMDRCYDSDIYANGERAGEFKKGGCAVREELEDVCATVKQTSQDGILRAAAYFHLNFEEIRPFADGNGRVGEILMNYYLITHNYPPTIIFVEDKDTYFEELHKFDETSNIDGFIQFLKEQTVKTWELCRNAEK
jgi:Fic family protein